MSSENGVAPYAPGTDRRKGRDDCLIAVETLGHLAVLPYLSSQRDVSPRPVDRDAGLVLKKQP